MVHIKIKKDTNTLKYITILRKYDNSQSISTIKSNIENNGFVLCHNPHLRYDISDDLQDIDRNKIFRKLLNTLIGAGAEIEIYQEDAQISLEILDNWLQRIEEIEREVEKDMEREVTSEEIKSIIKEWIIRIDQAETLPENIIALNFGLYEPYGVELIGSASYEEEDDDWACDEDFVPTERTCPALNIDEEEKWEEVLIQIQSILKELVVELKELSILHVEHITTGFCDGDLWKVKG